MYKYHPPKPLVIDLCDKRGFELRQAAAEYLEKNLNLTGAERGSQEQQGFGALAEIVVRHNIGFPLINPKDHPVNFDIDLPTKVKLDVKCRGGRLAFKTEYESDDGISREAKHNIFARQVYNEDLETDIYLLTHLEHPSKGELPGTERQRKWKLYIGGWVSKRRVVRDGVYLPRGSLTEQGSKWFPYRGQNIEFYNQHLNGIKDLKELLKIDKKDVKQDETKPIQLHLTSVDALRIAYDLLGRGIFTKKELSLVEKEIKLKGVVKPILHPNQYHHLLKMLCSQKKIGKNIITKAKKMIPPKPYKSI